MKLMRNTAKLTALAFAAAMLAHHSTARDLFSSGRTDYRIVLSADASESEATAAADFREAVRKIGGADMPIVKSSAAASGPAVYIGYSQAVGKLTGKAKPEDTDESFTYMTSGDNLIILGGRNRGSLYGVYAFLENELGVRWYTPDCSVYPKRKSYALRAGMSRSESPAIAFRYNACLLSQSNYDWALRNRENMQATPQKNARGNMGGYNSCHTMRQFMPADEFFKKHPEYFALRGGKRVSNGQLCLSNKNVLRICTERLLQRMQQQPYHDIYSLSQSDNTLYCECAKCKAIEDKYGGHSGLLLWFVNQAAREVKKKFPQKYVGTFAYQYTRKPPRGIKPESNVVIRLCSVECCFAHPLADSCNSDNRSFLADLAGWSKIADKLFVWDYVADFHQYAAPWPNFQVLAPNIRTFRDNHVVGVLEEGTYNSLASDFQEMKAWVIDRLLWNPNLDTDSLVADFITGYYGKAAPKVMEYYRLCQAQITPDHHFGIAIEENDPLYTDKFVKSGTSLLKDARRLAKGDTTTLARVDRVRLQMLYLRSMRQKRQAMRDGTWQEFKKLAAKYQLRPRETKTLEQFASEYERR